MADEHPVPWLAPLLNGVEHANPIILSLACPEPVEGSKDETRATEYSKAATRGTGTMCGDRGRSRHQTASSGRGFDRRQKAKGEAANDGLSAEASAQEEDDMFNNARVAAE